MGSVEFAARSKNYARLQRLQNKTRTAEWEREGESGVDPGVA